MFITNQKGSAAVEMVYVIVFFLAFVTVLQNFSTLAALSHDTAIRVQNEVESLMIENGRPVCLEELNEEGSLVRGSRFGLFGGVIRKRLTFVSEPICGGN